MSPFSVGTICVHTDGPTAPALSLSRGNPLFQPASDKMTLRSALPSGAGADAIPQHTLQEVA